MRGRWLATPEAGVTVDAMASTRAFSYLAVSQLVPVFALALAATTAVTDARAELRSYEITADEMTRQAAEHFPIQRCALMLACVTLSDPKVKLLDGDSRIHVTTTVRPEVGGQPLDSGEVDLAGTPRYVPEQGAFFLDDARVTEARFPGLKPQQARTVSDLASGMLAESLRREPIYELDDKDARQALARLVLREVRVRDGKLQLVTGADEP